MVHVEEKHARPLGAHVLLLLILLRLLLLLSVHLSLSHIRMLIPVMLLF
jgi:hypothetical protein